MVPTVHIAAEINTDQRVESRTHQTSLEIKLVPALTSPLEIMLAIPGTQGSVFPFHVLAGGIFGLIKALGM